MYLAHAASGIASFRTFVESYRRHPAGMEHRLLVVYKGFSQSRDDYRQLLAGVSHDEIDVPDRGYDVGSYRDASQALESSHVCFLNSASEVLSPDWLRMLFDHATQREVGAAGATGSWESFLTNYEQSSRPPRDAFVLERSARSVKRWFKLRRYRADFFPAPNPHLRTNAFIIERSRWLSLTTGPLRAKEDLWRFESGKQSMTRQLLAQGLEVMVVGRDGVAYPKTQWPASATFRGGEQRNLLVADNRTRQYEQADEAEKRRLASLAWASA